MIRDAAVAGRFYSGSFDSLRAEIEKYVDDDAVKDKVVGLISPHAGYMFSGRVAGATISRIKLAHTFVIIGPNHAGRGERFSIMPQGSWKTPLGSVEINSELAGQILNESDVLVEDELAHLHEHSIEVQLPFLQYFRVDVKIVPILIARADSKTCNKIGMSIAKVIRDSGQDVVIIASSDMTHYESQEIVKEKDMKAINAIIDLNEIEMMERIEADNITMCGFGPVACLLVAARELGATEAELVLYQTSGDVTGDRSSVVGYAGVIIK